MLGKFLGGAVTFTVHNLQKSRLNGGSVFKQDPKQKTNDAEILVSKMEIEIDFTVGKIDPQYGKERIFILLGR